MTIQSTSMMGPNASRNVNPPGPAKPPAAALPVVTVIDTRVVKKPVPYPIILSVLLGSLFMISVPAGSSEVDAAIEAAARASYVFNTSLKDDVVVASSKNGEVTLTGFVSDDSHKALAGEAVASIDGVTKVDNQIQMKEVLPARSDTWLFLRINNTLALHRSVNAGDTKVEVSMGKVTLSGEATSEAQKELITEYVEDIEGVRDVSNEMRIVPGKPEQIITLSEIIDDASITAQVRIALATHRSTSAITTTVTTSRGVVTVGGQASNQAEITLVSKLASDIRGVLKVINSMTVRATLSGQ